MGTKISYLSTKIKITICSEVQWKVIWILNQERYMTGMVFEEEYSGSRMLRDLKISLLYSQTELVVNHVSGHSVRKLGVQSISKSCDHESLKIIESHFPLSKVPSFLSAKSTVLHLLPLLLHHHHHHQATLLLYVLL